MIESIFITMMSIGFISLVIGKERDEIIYLGISLLMWLVVMAGHVYIEVPSVTDTFYEVGILPVSLGFIFIDVILIINHYFEFTGISRGKEIEPSRRIGRGRM